MTRWNDKKLSVVISTDLPADRQERDLCASGANLENCVFILQLKKSLDNILQHSIEFKRTAVKDLEKIDTKEATRILTKIKILENGLKGDIKKLTNFTPEYRFRIGNFRILFEIVDNKIIIYRIMHRKESYR